MAIDMNNPSTKIDPLEFAKTIADATRQQIMRVCCCQWKSVTEIVDCVDVAQPTVSHHLAILRDAGLVDVYHEGKLTYYRLNQNQLKLCCGQIVVKFSNDGTESTR
jgi:DNA-binding transcriptional ArsR family regulator